MNFDKVIKLGQADLKARLEKELKREGYENVVNQDGFLYAEGSIPVLLVAHMDTVHRQLVSTICKGGNIWMAPEGIGGDDRCGIYSILQVIRHYKCHVLFTEDEETGCKGAGKFTRSTLKPEVNFCIEIDRKGSDDCVFYSCYNEDFIKFIEGFGFKTAYGSCSDISSIAPYLGVAAVNLSSGYYNPHTEHEYINIDDMWNTIRRIEQILDGDIPKFEYKVKQAKVYQYPSATTNKSNATHWWEQDDDDDGYYNRGGYYGGGYNYYCKKPATPEEIASRVDTNPKKIIYSSLDPEVADIIWMYECSDEYFIRHDYSDTKFHNCDAYGVDKDGNIWWWDDTTDSIIKCCSSSIYDNGFNYRSAKMVYNELNEGNERYCTIANLLHEVANMDDVLDEQAAIDMASQEENEQIALYTPGM